MKIDQKGSIKELKDTIQRLLIVISSFLILIVLVFAFVIMKPNLSRPAEGVARSNSDVNNPKVVKEKEKPFWIAADINLSTDNKAELLYGKELIAHTAKYLGPKGAINRTTNGMNCQNCHLEAGSKTYGNNYGAVFATYPKYRARSGQKEDLVKRINDCMERSLNGHALAIQSEEMQAMKSYIEYLGKNVPKGEKPKGSGIYDLPFIDRPADPGKGHDLFMAKCISCHQSSGEGLLAADQTEYTYPPLWGKHSYNIGAGLYRLSRFAGYIKYNMPQGATFKNAQLTDEQAWDLAAYVNSQPRPSKDLSKDWPKMKEKPFDHPFGPFADLFTEQQHKYGPFKAIAAANKK